MHHGRKLSTRIWVYLPPTITGSIIFFAVKQKLKHRIREIQMCFNLQLCPRTLALFLVRTSRTDGAGVLLRRPLSTTSTAQTTRGPRHARLPTVRNSPHERDLKIDRTVGRERNIVFQPDNFQSALTHLCVCVWGGKTSHNFTSGIRESFLSKESEKFYKTSSCEIE